LNPFVLARLELVSPRPVAEALGALERLVVEGVDVDGRHYRLFGGRRGDYFSMSLGMPVLGGGAPVLRVRSLADAGPPRLLVTVGARIELIVFGTFWALITAVGGGYQLLLQLAAVAAGRAGASAVLEVLPGIGIMVGILLLGWWMFRRRGESHTRFLLACFHRALGIAPPDRAAAAAPPLH
jgi:hypothetical protein